jgi:hypothetical protein
MYLYYVIYVYYVYPACILNILNILNILHILYNLYTIIYTINMPCSDMMGGQLLPGPLLHVFQALLSGRHNSMPDSAVHGALLGGFGWAPFIDDINDDLPAW